jgi:hypothetical protein
MGAFGQVKSPGDESSGALVKWETSCVQRGCVLQTEVLRGESGDPPDTSDFREYISIDVAFERATQKPAYFAFHVHPGADHDQGVFIGFTKAGKNGDSSKVNLDSDGTSKLEIADCDDKSCIARVPLGLVKKGKDSGNLNLLDKFLKADDLLLLYTKGGKQYRTMLVLSSFRTEYLRVLTTEFGSSGKK